MTTKRSLPLSEMGERHRGLTTAVATSYLEAARVSLDRYHLSPVDFVLRNGQVEIVAEVAWETADDRCQGAWANQDDATRDGAYACAIAATEMMTGLVAVRRAETLTGSDYYVAPPGKGIEDLEDCWRLEVSGTTSGEYEVDRRLKSKVKQALEGKSNLPALAVVVGFKVKLILFEKAESAL